MTTLPPPVSPAVDRGDEPGTTEIVAALRDNGPCVEGGVAAADRGGGGAIGVVRNGQHESHAASRLKGVARGQIGRAKRWPK